MSTRTRFDGPQVIGNDDDDLRRRERGYQRVCKRKELFVVGREGRICTKKDEENSVGFGLKDKLGSKKERVIVDKLPTSL